MKVRLTHFLFVSVPGLCFVSVGTLTKEYPAVVLGGILVIGSFYELSGKRVALGNSDQKRRGRSFALAGVIGASFAIAGIVSHSYVLAAAGAVILIGALGQLYRTTPHDAR
jgi:hypothetical protein